MRFRFSRKAKKILSVTKDKQWLLGSMYSIPLPRWCKLREISPVNPHKDDSGWYNGESPSEHPQKIQRFVWGTFSFFFVLKKNHILNPQFIKHEATKGLNNAMHTRKSLMIHWRVKFRIFRGMNRMPPSQCLINNFLTSGLLKNLDG